MSGLVVNHDFGKQHRDSVRAFARLMDLAEEQERDMLRNPVKWIKEAHKEIQRLRYGIREAVKARHAQTAFPTHWADEAPRRRLDTVLVPAERLRGLEAMSEKLEALV